MEERGGSDPASAQEEGTGRPRSVYCSDENKDECISNEGPLSTNQTKKNMGTRHEHPAIKVKTFKVLGLPALK